MSATTVLNLAKAGFTDEQVKALAELRREFPRELTARDLRAAEAGVGRWPLWAMSIAMRRPVAVVAPARFLPGMR